MLSYLADFFKKNLNLQLVVLLAALLFSFTQVYAKAGCCSRHGGVVGCDSNSGHQLCKDGTPSPTCPCQGTVINKSATTTSKTKTKMTSPATAGSAAGTRVTTTATTKKTKTMGCCSRHGGVKGCNKSTGHQMCKDGTESAACSC